jgi:hypothetical protein
MDHVLRIAESEDNLCPTVLSEAQAPWRILHVNAAWCELCGFDESEAVGQSFEILQGKGTDLCVARDFTNQLRTKRSADTVLLNYTRACRPFRHNIHARRACDPSSGEAFYVTLSHEEPPQPRSDALSDVFCTLFILVTACLYVLSVLLAGSPLDECVRYGSNAETACTAASHDERSALCSRHSYAFLGANLFPERNLVATFGLANSELVATLGLASSGAWACW